VKKSLSLFVLSFALQAFGFICLQYGIEPFRHYFYVTCWWSYIILADTVLAYRRGEFLVLNRRLPMTIMISSGYWCIFEALNIRLQNWHYINLPAETALRYAGYFLSFGTVIPAVMVTKELIAALFPRLGSDRDFDETPGNRKWYPAAAITCGIVCLALVIVLPRFAFPLAWAFLALLCDGWNYRRGYPSFMKEIENRSSAGLVAGAASGLICGLLWEAWNYHAAAKWIYTVPFVQGPKLFEMPLPGYAGFPAFGIETVAFVALLKGIGAGRAGLYVLSGVFLALSLAVFPLIDRYTVLSCDILYR